MEVKHHIKRPGLGKTPAEIALGREMRGCRGGYWPGEEELHDKLHPCEEVQEVRFLTGTSNGLD